MNELLIILLFLLIGYVSGILIGMLGIGGGLIFVPVLYYLLPLLKIPQTALAYYTIGTSLFAGSMGTSVSAFLHNRVRNFIKKPAVIVSIGAAFTAFAAPYFVVQIHSQVIEIIFGSVLFLVAIRLFFENKINKLYFSSRPVNDKFFIVLGILVGIFSAFTGLGGGVIYVPTLIYLFHIDTKAAVGTSSIIVAVTMISSTSSYLFQNSDINPEAGAYGYVVFQAAIPIGIGAVLGAFTGVKIVLKSSVKLLRNVFAIILFIAIARILLQIF